MGGAESISNASSETDGRLLSITAHEILLDVATRETQEQVIIPERPETAATDSRRETVVPEADPDDDRLSNDEGDDVLAFVPSPVRKRPARPPVNSPAPKKPVKTAEASVWDFTTSMLPQGPKPTDHFNPHKPTQAVTNLAFDHSTVGFKRTSSKDGLLRSVESKRTLPVPKGPSQLSKTASALELRSEYSNRPTEYRPPTQLSSSRGLLNTSNTKTKSKLTKTKSKKCVTGENTSLAKELLAQEELKRNSDELGTSSDPLTSFDLGNLHKQLQTNVLGWERTNLLNSSMSQKDLPMKDKRKPNPRMVLASLGGT